MPSAIASRILDSLNKMLDLDEKLVCNMKSIRFECLPALLRHPTLRFLMFAGDQLPAVGMLGVVNSFLDPDEEKIVLRESETKGKWFFKVITPKDPDFLTAYAIADDELDQVVNRIVPVHGGLCVYREYTKVDGKYQMRRSIRPLDETDPMVKQARELAAANPGQAVFGCSVKDKPDGKPTITTGVLPIEMEKPK